MRDLDYNTLNAHVEALRLDLENALTFMLPIKKMSCICFLEALLPR